MQWQQESDQNLVCRSFPFLLLDGLSLGKVGTG